MKFKYYKELFKQKFTKNNISKFVKNQGFYVVLFICVAAVGATALIMAGKRDEDELVQENDNTTHLQAQNQLSETIDDVLETDHNYFITEQDATETEETQETSVTKAKSNTILTIKRPHSGEIVNGFKGDVVVFNESLNQWASHNATDFAGEIGDDVLAAIAGEVVDVYEDALSGGVVVLKHGNDMVSVYKNIAPDADLTAKDKIDAGQVIGSIAKSGIKEEHLGPHLHFEFYINDKAVDAEKYFG